jgi:hypothetical protein
MEIEGLEPVVITIKVTASRLDKFTEETVATAV